MVSSGTAAIKIGLKSLGVKNGDEVITQSFNFIATIEAILDAGAIPRITSIDESLNMCPKDLKKKINKKTKAIIPVHMLGFSANLKEIKTIAKKKKIKILEDNCESIGAKFNKRYLGVHGHVGVFSLDFVKIYRCNDKKIFNYCNNSCQGNDKVKIHGYGLQVTRAWKSTT